jgi:AAHS family 4-hydroxybenzoate transporter-like MFS transporter
MGAAGIPAQSAFALSTLLPIGGALSGIVISAFRLLERGGLAFVAALFLISGPVIASFGYAGKDQMLLAVAVFTAGFCFNAVQFCLNATATMLYPEDVRSLGVGWASGLARLGSIAGPAIGGYLLGVIRLPLTDLYLCAAAPMVLGLALAWALKLTAPLAVQRENQ